MSLKKNMNKRRKEARLVEERKKIKDFKTEKILERKNIRKKDRETEIVNDKRKT